MLQSFKYVLDANGNRLSRAFADGSYESYLYDSGNRLTQASTSAGATTSYTLNGYNQITNIAKSLNGYLTQTTTNTLNTFNQLTQQVVNGSPGSGTTNYAYDGNGNLTTAAPTTGQSTVYRYDADNRMTEVDLPGGLVDTYKYDADGLRVEKSDSTGTTNYLLDGPSVVTEYDGTSTLKAIHSNNPQRIDEQFSLTQNGTKYWPVCDALGSVYEWVDRSGNVAGAYSYDVYGARTQTSGGLSTAWGYTGREQDADTGLNYNRDRYLNAATASWMQADRLGQATATNYYTYATLNPSTNVDPSGQATLAEVASEVRNIHTLYEQWLVQKGAQIGNSLLQSLYWWLGQPNQVCGDLGFELAAYLGSAGMPDLTIRAFFAPDPFYVLWPDTGVEVWGTYDDEYLGTRTVRFDVLFPYARLAIYF